MKRLFLVLNPKTGKYDMVGILSNPFEVIFKETNRFYPRWKNPKYKKERKYKFIFCTPWGLMFIHNLLCHQMDFYNPALYQCRAGAQLLFRAIASSNFSTWRKLNTMASFAGVTVKNVSDKQRIIESYLNELEQKNLIGSWEKKGKGRKAQYWVAFKK